jgi:acyl-CoA synthetase (NDP forming)
MVINRTIYDIILKYRLVAISLSGGFSVMLGDACEKHGFTCPALPESLIQKIESFRRGGG